MVPLESLGTVSYSHFIVTTAVPLADSEIFSIKLLRYLEIWVWGLLMSLKMTPFNRPYMTFYCSAIVNIALSCTTFQFFGIEYHHDLEIRSLKLVSFKSLGMVSYSPSIVTMALYCIVSEIKGDTG